MVRQKTVQKIANKPKTDKKRRTKEQIDRVKKRGEKMANIAGAIIALSSIRRCPLDFRKITEKFKDHYVYVH